MCGAGTRGSQCEPVVEFAGETPLLDSATEKDGPLCAPSLHLRERYDTGPCGIRALWAAKSIFRGERHPEGEKARLDGGEGGIRTHGWVSPTPAFEAGSFNRSDTSPVQSF